MTNLPHRKGERYRCFVVVQPTRGWSGAYGQTWRGAVWRCEDCGFELRGDMAPYMRARMADHHECGHAPCARCGKPLLRRKDGTPRQHRYTECAGKSDGDKIEREFVKHMREREYV